MDGPIRPCRGPAEGNRDRLAVFLLRAFIPLVSPTREPLGWLATFARTYGAVVLVGVAAGWSSDTPTQFQPVANSLSLDVGISPLQIGIAVRVALLAAILGARLIVALSNTFGQSPRPGRDPRAWPVIRAVALSALVIVVQGIALFIGDGSAAVGSDLLHNVAEAPAHVALIAAYALRRRHPEANAERVIQGTMVAAGLAAIWTSVTTLRHGHASGGMPPLVGAAASFAGARLSGTILYRAWREHGGATLRRAIDHLRLDAWGILAVIAGVLAASAGLAFADPLAGFVVAGLMLWGGLRHHHDDRDGAAVA